MEKKILRKKLLSMRKQLSEEFVCNASNSIYHHILNTKILNFNNILAYSDFQNEVVTDDIINYLLSKKRAVYLPKCNIEDKTFRTVKIFGNDSFEHNIYGILEPQNDSDTFDKQIIDCAIVPGIAFDTEGNRIGFGCGYYDKFLMNNSNVYKIGLCYEFQIVKKIENDVYDIPMDIIITEKRIIDCERG